MNTFNGFFADGTFAIWGNYSMCDKNTYYLACSGPSYTEVLASSLVSDNGEVIAEGDYSWDDVRAILRGGVIPQSI